MNETKKTILYRLIDTFVDQYPGSPVSAEWRDLENPTAIEIAKPIMEFEIRLGDQEQQGLAVIKLLLGL